MPMTEARSTTFVHINWTASNAPLSMDLVPHVYQWDRNTEFNSGLHFIGKDELKNVVKQYSIEKHQQYKVVESTKKNLDC